MAIKEFWECNRCGKHIEQAQPQAPMSMRMEYQPCIVNFLGSGTPLLGAPRSSSEFLYCEGCEKIVLEFLNQRFNENEIQVTITADGSQFFEQLEKIKAEYADLQKLNLLANEI